MPDEPDTNTPDNSDEEIGMDDHEAKAGFLEDRDPEDYPSVLRITSDTDEAHRQDALDRLERWEAGEEVPHVINFQNPSDLRTLLTDRRVELLRSIMTERPDSIRQLAERLERDVKTVHDDLQVLADYDVVYFEQAGRAKRPFVPYDSIEVCLEITTASPADDTAPA
ncbi:transcriptional regulator [Natrarchaeobius sp. A-rgal3]|uniref:HVO_A0114 family putative DNA-binding protein n=1 Tax=Natrarchaeobius versutus TaxID=1679078 RepID=UPI00351019A7